MVRTVAALLGLGLMLGTYPAAALTSQPSSPQPAPPGVTPAPMAPPSVSSTPPEKIAPADKDVTQDHQTLSNKLARQQGTLAPPHDVDPGMQVQPPAQAQATMPVIPPPGSPGGNQKVQPK